VNIEYIDHYYQLEHSLKELSNIYLNLIDILIDIECIILLYFEYSLDLVEIACIEVDLNKILKHKIGNPQNNYKSSKI
jgi:hypothetical protein